ncbi:YLP motif-containing protein 1-like [Enoplosus armatus]|uniref:YLP motif-containing protein 1-like n=1 Tax=Enoplosus armatus TaxID=215367 RepID=UPI003996579B
MDYVDQILSICSTIYKMAENVKANKERCQRVTQRVQALQELVLTIKQRGPGQISATVENALKELSKTLDAAKEMMVKYSRTKPVMNFLKSSRHEEKFCKVNERLTDNFQVLSGALQIEQGNMLSKVFETVAGKRQDEEYCIGQPPTSPTAPMPLPRTMPVFNPTAPMPLPGTMPVSSPTAPMPPPVTMPVSSPITPMPLVGIMPPLQMSSPTTPMLAPGIMPPMQMSSPTAPMPPLRIMPPIQMSSPTTVMPLHGTMAPIRFSTIITSRTVLASGSPSVISSTIAHRPVHRIIATVGAPFAPMTFSRQNTSVVRNYVVNNSYFP